MLPHRTTPLSVLFSRTLIRIAARLVPLREREEWQREWFAEVWHCWQFLHYAGLWNNHEAFRLIRNCLGAFSDATWLLISQEKIWENARERARSPQMCIAALAALLLIVAALSSGLPATRQLLTLPWQRNAKGLLFIWRHPAMDGGDRGLPPDVVPAWAKQSRSLMSVAGFTVSKDSLLLPNSSRIRPLVVATDPHLFAVLNARPLLGALPTQTGIVLDHRTWVNLFRADPKIVGSRIYLGREFFKVSAVLPEDFQFLTRQPTVYRVQQQLPGRLVMVVARARFGASEGRIDRELTSIAEDATYYFFRSELRFRSVESAFFAPLGSFGLAILIATMLAVSVYRPSLHRLRDGWKAENRRAVLKRAGFFSAKVTLALGVLFTAGLEWSRSGASLMFGSRDPGSGPLLLWIYIAGAMGVFFCSVADQRARCRVCLRLLCFPVRVGCPGCLLLDWSGTELLCTKGHGILHVPHLAPSWADEAEHWIALDESWHDLFTATKEPT